MKGNLDVASEDVASKPKEGSNLAGRSHRSQLFKTPIAWIVYLAIGMFCIYRIGSFQPIPLDSPGTLRPILYSWFHFYSGLFVRPQYAFVTWNVLCYLALCTFPLLALMNYFQRQGVIHLPSRVARVVFARSVFWIGYASCLFLCRFPALLRDELNPDEGQFLASAWKLFHDSNFYRSVDCGTSGPFNIFPLMLPAVFGLSPDFASSRAIALIAIFFSIYLLYRTIGLLTSEDLARIAILPVAIAFPVFTNKELLHYSSEHIPVLLVALTLYVSTRVLVNPEAYRGPVFLLGLIACTGFFTKMQCLPILCSAVAVVLACIYSTGHVSRTLQAVLLFVAGIAPLMILNAILCFHGGVWGDFLATYVASNSSYADTNLSFTTVLRPFLRYVTEPVEVRSFLFTVFAIAMAYAFQKLRFVGSVALRILLMVALIAAGLLLRPDNRLLLLAFLAIAGLFLAPLYFLVLHKKGELGIDPTRWFGLLAYLSAVAAFFSVYKAHRGFVHYLLFLFIPLGAAAAWMLIRRGISRDNRTRTGYAAFVVALTLGCGTYLWGFQNRQALEISEIIRAPEGDFIRTVTNPGARIFVWGWTIHPYLASGRVSATRDTNVSNVFRQYNLMSSPPTFVSTPASDQVSAFNRSRILRDLNTNPPELFIDSTGPRSWFLTDPEYFAYERVPEIAAFVDQRYVHLADLYDQRYFLRRDLAAQRDARFNRPSPPRSCAHGSVNCFTALTSLPRESTYAPLPSHARIEIEFMPIGRQIGAATVFNTEAQPNSFRGLRLQHTNSDRYLFLAGLGDRWTASREFVLPQDTLAFLSIEFDGNSVSIRNNGFPVDKISLARPVVDATGPIDLGSWIHGMDPFSGTIRFFQTIDLDKPVSTTGKRTDTLRGSMKGEKDGSRQ